MHCFLLFPFPPLEKMDLKTEPLKQCYVWQHCCDDVVLGKFKGPVFYPAVNHYWINSKFVAVPWQSRNFNVQWELPMNIYLIPQAPKYCEYVVLWTLFSDQFNEKRSCSKIVVSELYLFDHSSAILSLATAAVAQKVWRNENSALVGASRFFSFACLFAEEQQSLRWIISS